ncbi:MAG TPA: rod shape-determining protein MreD [Candidatus Avacidaminococcus intestinavium]|uniref:Rod shape-determining protein MreD n=1 Tax=Candidatus Avacidaminococcus intestinavium TaxID=2840684 RepID=A0A9D1MR73_9FIRM|nr:rod shape-determining protein MreD [Candidatus Avacidaminococcus intestinavium]
MALLLRSLVLFFLIVLQTSWFAFFPGYNVTPDFLLLFIVFYAMNTPTKYGALNALGVGLMQDILGATIFGFHILTRTVAAFVIGKMKKRVMKENIEAFLVFATVAGLFCRFSYAILQIIISDMEFFWLPSYLLDSFYYIVLNLVMAVPLWFGIGKIEAFLTKRNSY